MGLVEFLVRMTADNSDLKKKMKDSEKATSAFGSSVGKMAGMMGLSFAAAGAAVVAFSLASYKAWQESEKMSRKLMASVKGNETAFKALTSQAGKLQRELGVDDESIMQLQSLAASSDKSTEEIKKLTEASVYLSKVTGQDLQAAYLQINNTFTGSAGRLGRLDDEFSTLTKEQLIHGDAVDLVIKKYKDLAKAQTTTSEKMSSNWENLQENIGQFAGPTVNNLLEGFNNWLVLINSNLLTTGEKLKLAFTFTSPEALINEKQAVLDNVEAWKLYDIQQSQIGFLKTAAGIDAVTAAMKKLYAKNYGEGGKWQGQKPTTAISSGVKKANPFANMDFQIGNPAVEEYKSFLQDKIKGQKQYNDAAAKLREENDAADMAALENVGEFHMKMAELDVIVAKQKAEKIKQIDRELLAYDLQSVGMIAGQMQSMFEEQTVAYKALAIAQIGVSTAVAAIAALSPPPIGAGPLLGPILAGVTIAAGAAAAAQVAGIKFADGGIVSGPTHALVGEYAGAKSNPEVIAPLSKLQNMLGNRQQVEVVGYISGDVIRLANKRSEYIYNRRG